MNEGLGASTRPNSKQPLERTVIELRYGIRILEQRLVAEAQAKYDVENIIINEERIPALSLKP